MTMTQSEFRTSWIAALRSDEYKQRRGQLCRVDGSFCCLGVACELLVKEGMLERQGQGYRAGKELREGYLPGRSCKFIGLRSRGGLPRGEELPLSGLNDTGKSFEEIATALETEEYWSD